MNKNFIYHFIFRYSDKSAPPSGTIKLHADVIQKNGSVWLGKFGKKVGKRTISLLQGQINKNIPSYTFLVGYSDRNFIVHAGETDSISDEIPDYSLIPSYYAKDAIKVYTWFKLKSLFKVETDILRTLTGDSSKLPIILTLQRSMSSIMLVRLKKSETIDDYK